MADVQRKLVHKQFNSPMGLYSQQNVAETLNRELKAFGSQGIEIDEQIAKPLNLANSAVLRAVEEEEEMKCGAATTTMQMQQQQRKQHQQKHELFSDALHEVAYCSGQTGCMPIDTIPLPTSVINRSFDNVSPRPYITIEGYKRVAWPPASEERIVREFTPQPQTQYQPVPAYNQQQQQPPSAAKATPAQQQYRAPSYDIYQQPQQQQQQYPPQAQYQSQAPLSQNQYQQPPQAVSPYQQQPPQQQPAWAQQQQPQQQYQQPPWVQQPQPNQQYQQQPQYQSPLNQYNQAPNHHQAQQQHHQQQPQQQQQQQYNNQYVSQSNQQQFNSYSQPQQQQNIVSHDQVDQHNKLAQDQRGVSPGIITLRKEAPITQQPAPVYSSQPAAISFRESSADVDSLGGSNMRGDLKWPPPEYKEAAAKENEERRKLALGPVCRPRKVKRDYTEFFAKNALSHHYPSYKVPPGTQHMTY